MPRVALILPDLRPGAPLTEALALAAGLRAHGVTPVVAALSGRGPGGAPLISAGAAVHDLRRRHACDPFAARLLRRLLRQTGAGVAHAWGPDAWRHALWAAPRRLPLVVTDDSPAGIRRAYRARWPRAGRRVVRVTAVRGPAGPSAAWFAPRGVRPGLRGVAGREALLARLGFPPSTRLVVACARLTSRKRTVELLWAADLLRALDADARVVVVGEGPRRAALERFAAGAVDPGYVAFLGEVEGLRPVLRVADVYWHAGDEVAPPYAVLEAMAAGVPVVADRTPGAAAALGPTVGGPALGVLIDPGDRAQRARATFDLLHDPRRARNLAEAARTRVEGESSIEAWVARHAELYRLLAATPTPAQRGAHAAARGG